MWGRSGIHISNWIKLKHIRKYFLNWRLSEKNHMFYVFIKYKKRLPQQQKQKCKEYIVKWKNKEKATMFNECFCGMNCISYYV